MAKVTNENGIINVGSNYRIEKGPALVSEIASAELLSNDRTADHYIEGQRDATGKVIKIGEPITFLEWGGKSAPKKDVYYIFERQEVDASDENSPHFVPEHIRNSQSENRTHYTYIWREVATRATEEAALDYAQKKAVD